MSSDLGSLFTILQTSYVTISFEFLQVYDHVLTINDEIQFVWSTSWSLGKVLYFLTRYSPYLNIVPWTWSILGPPVMSAKLCGVLNLVNGWIVLAGLMVAETIMLLRVWAMWNQSRKCGIFLLVLALVAIVVGSLMYATFLRHVSLGDIPAETSMRGCHIKFEDNATYISFLVLMAFEIIMLILTVIKGLRDLHPKIKYSSSSSSSFLFKFYQDGVLYYTVLAAVSFANAMVLLFADREFALVLLALVSVHVSQSNLSLRDLLDHRGPSTQFFPRVSSFD
ncbi:hypothetical protein ONZ45_g6857 [Pleurotus djamor]|nr:hypothetical protein ONZ45_g6857 [Pleurotus djamor]